MAKKKTSQTRLKLKSEISGRLRLVRQQLFGEHGGPELARRLGLPARTWYNYETGVTVPAEVLLNFIEQTGVNSNWLLNGTGPVYCSEKQRALLESLTPEQLIRRGLEKLESQEDSSATDRLEFPKSYPYAEPNGQDYVSIPIISPRASETTPSAVPGNPAVMVAREWLPHPNQTVAIQISDDSMHPVLPIGSIVAVDSVQTDLDQLNGKLIAYRPDEQSEPMIRWLNLRDQVLILDCHISSRTEPTVVRRSLLRPEQLMGRVVWSWSVFVRFDEAGKPDPVSTTS